MQRQLAAAQQRASSAREKLEQFAQQQRLQERLQEAQRAATKAAQQAADEAQKRARQVDAEYDVSGKAAGAAKTAAEGARRVNDAAEELESRWQVRRRMRNAFTDFKRATPQVMSQVRDFFNTPLGAVTFLFLFMLSVFTGAFWVIVRWVFSLLWLFILLGPLIINYLNAQAVREQQQRYREYVEEQRRRQADPFYGTPFEGVFGGERRGGGSTAPRKYASEDVIDISIDRTDD
ncbi:hypothetical protein ABPG75_007964 [Micractinium tetrahymenae]